MIMTNGTGDPAKGRLLMVGCGFLGQPYLRRAHERGLRVSVLDSEAVLAWDPDGAELGPGDSRRLVAETDDESWIAAAAEVLREDGPVTAVLPFSEPHVRAAALLAEELGLPGPGLRAAWTSRNKYLQRELFARHRLAQPGFFLARGPASGARCAAGRYPVVLKPLSEAGSTGVQVVSSPSELAAWCAGRDHDTPFLVEQYLTGQEYSVEAIADQGVIAFSSITRKTTTPPPFCVELEHRVPAGCDGATSERVSDLLRRVVSALGMGSGIIHLEFRLEPPVPHGTPVPHIVEVAVRTPGDLIMEIVEYATGVDLFDATLAVACGQRPVIGPPTRRAACVWYPVVAPGVVTSVDGITEAGRLDGVRYIYSDVTVGDQVHPFRSSEERVSAALIDASDLTSLDVRLARVRREVRITTTGDSAEIKGERTVTVS
jgi:biotin carboxylase